MCADGSAAPAANYAADGAELILNPIGSIADLSWNAHIPIWDIF